MKLILSLFLMMYLVSCGDSVEPVKVEKSASSQKPYQQNATDAVGVAEGDKQVSPFGKPSH